MSLKDEIRRLIDRVREIEDRLYDLENEAGGRNDQIGFEVDENEGADFDEDAPEY
jgi:hypothetical protein